MNDKVSRLAPTGKMDRDSDPRYVGKGDAAGDYRDARNVQRVTPEEGDMGSVEPVLGNEFAFDLGSVSQQNKRYRITFDGDATKQHEARFLSTQRDANMVVGTGPNQALQFNGTQGSFVSAFNTAISGSGVSWVLSVIGSDTVEIELASYPMYQWFMESSGPDPVGITCVTEAIPADLAGPLKDIGSYDLLGDLFVFSTTQDNEPTAITPTIILVGPTSGGIPNTYLGPLTSIIFNGEHGLVQGQWIRITGSNEAFLNGLFVVHSIVDPQTVRIVTSTAWGVTPTVTTLGTPQVFIHPSGIGEIGVARKDDNAEVWTYTRLLRSVELNFVSKWMPDITCEKNSERVASYFDDDYNSFRKFYYIGDYLSDGALSSPNQYSFDNIRRQVSGFLDASGIYIDLDSQLDAGGDLPSGNIRYFVVFEDAFGNETGPSDLSQHVICYSDQSNGVAIGDEDSATSGKVNVLRISGIDTSVYRRISLGYTVNAGGVNSAYLNQFIPVTGDEMIISHTGYEEKAVYDIGIIQSNTETPYRYAKNIRHIDNRLVRSNLRKDEAGDLESFFKTFKHRICVDRIDETKHSQSSPPGGYKDPMNVFYKMGYMYNETYRFAGRVKFKDGSTTGWYWIDDIKIDPFLSNQANPSDNRRDQTGLNISTSFDLTEPIQGTFPVERKILVPYVDFFGFDPTFPIGSESIYSVADSIEIGRAEVVPEVMACGLGIMSTRIKTNEEVPAPAGFPDDLGVLFGVRRGIKIGGAVEQSFGSTVRIDDGIGVREGDRVLSPAASASDTLHEYMFAYGGPFTSIFNNPTVLPNYFSENHDVSFLSGVDLDSISYPFLLTYPSSTGVDFYWNEYTKIQFDIINKEVRGVDSDLSLYQRSMRSERRVMSIYIPDHLITGQEFSGRSIIDFGEAYFDGGSVNGYLFRKFTGEIPYGVIAYHCENIGQTFNTYDIDRIEYVEDGERAQMFGQNVGFRKAYDWYTLSGDLNSGFTQLGISGLFNVKKSAVVYVENSGNGIVNTNKNADFGVRYVQIFDRKVDKYGPKSESNYYTTSAYVRMLDIPSTIVQKGVLSVFGGDTFTQEANIKTVYANNEKATAVTGGQPDFPFPLSGGPGFGKGVIMYSQNRYNAQLRHSSADQAVFLRDILDRPDWAFEWRLGDRDTYSRSYDLTNRLFLQSNGNQRPGQTSFDYPQRIQWSERAEYGRTKDSLLDFKLINIKDLDLRDGEIFHHENVNGELFTLQPRKWQRQLFNTRGELQVSGNAIGAVIGDGSVLARDGQTLSAYGTQNKWSCMLGKSDGGKDTLYWYNAENGLFMRFGADGTVVISERARLRSFANRAAKWLRGKDTPAFEQGVRAVWDDRSKEVIWTFTGWRTIDPWQSSGQSTIGTVVSNPNAPSDTYENLPRFFRCTVAHANSSSREPGVGADWQDFWEQIAYDDFEYYSVFTVAYNEMVNGFSTFYGHIPKTYLKWRDTFLSSHPTIRNLLFEHRKGLPGTWYGKAGVSEPKIEDAHIEMIMNDLPEQSKRYTAVEVLAEETPDLIEFRTKNQYTWADQANFKVNDDQYRAPIGRDATATNDPQGDSRRMDGDYLRVKFVFPGQVMNRLHSIVVKFRDRLRTFRR